MKTKLKQITIPLINHLGKRKEMLRFSKPPIIIGGCARSGTTLMLAILAAHPSIFVIPNEIRAFKNWITDNSDGNKIISPERMDRIYRYFLFRRISKTNTRWSEKDTINVRYFDNILEYYQNNVKLINIIRDGRDVMTSIHPENPERFWVSPEHWVYDVKYSIRYKQHKLVHTVKYEDLVQKFEHTIKNVMAFIEEDFHENLLKWHLHTPIKRSYGWFSSVEKVHNKSVGKWKDPKFHQRIKEIMQHDEVPKLLRVLNYM